MTHRSQKPLILVIFTLLAILIGGPKSFAQEDGSSDDQATENQTHQTLNQIHDLEVKMQNDARRLDNLETAVNKRDTEIMATDTDYANSPNQQYVVQEGAPVPVAPAQPVVIAKAVPIQVEAPVPIKEVAPVKAATLVQLASAKASPAAKPVAEIKTDPVNGYPPNSIYYAPITPLSKQNTFEISEETYFSTFKENGNYNVYRKRGAFYGLNMAYTYRPLNSENWPINVYHVDVHGDYGMLNYSYEGDKDKNVGNYVVEPRFWIGKDFNLGALTSLTPYVGAGYRWYFDDLKKKESREEDGGFNIRNQYVYIPAGAQLSIRPIDGWRVDLNSEYDYLVWGNVTNYKSQYSFGTPGFSNITNTFKKGYGLRGSIKIVKEENLFNYFVEPYIRYWNIKVSNTKQIIYEGVPISPYHEDKNQTIKAGARIGIEF